MGLLKKLKRVIEKGDGDWHVHHPFSRIGPLDLMFLVVMGLVIFLAYFFFEISKFQEIILWGIIILLIIFFLSLRFFGGLNGLKKIIKRAKSLKKH